MIIVMKADASEQEIGSVLRAIGGLGLQAHTLAGPTRTAIGITGNRGPVDALQFESMSGITEVIHCTEPYRLITLNLHPERTVVRVGDAAIGAGDLTIIAGPCGVVSRAQL